MSCLTLCRQGQGGSLILGKGGLTTGTAVVIGEGTMRWYLTTVVNLSGQWYLLAVNVACFLGKHSEVVYALQVMVQSVVESGLVLGECTLRQSKSFGMGMSFFMC